MNADQLYAYTALLLDTNARMRVIQEQLDGLLLSSKEDQSIERFSAIERNTEQTYQQCYKEAQEFLKLALSPSEQS